MHQMRMWSTSAAIRAGPVAVSAVASRSRASTRRFTAARRVVGARVVARRPARSFGAGRHRRSVALAFADADADSADPADPADQPVGLGLSDAELVVLLSSEDENVLTTALSRSIAVEDYALAAKLSARLKVLQGTSDNPAAEILDWRALGMAEWLCDRAESLGFRYPLPSRDARRSRSCRRKTSSSRPRPAAARPSLTSCPPLTTWTSSRAACSR